MDPIKIAGIKDWPTPVKVKDIRSFLGFCNFYCAFMMFHQTICQCCQTTQRSYEERPRVELDKGTSIGL